MKTSEIEKKIDKARSIAIQAVLDLAVLVHEAKQELIDKGQVISDNPNEYHKDWQKMGGDAGSANSKHFRVRWRVDSVGDVIVEIECPTFLRGPLTLHVHDKRVGGSY